MPGSRLAAMALTGFFALVIAACGGDDREPSVSASTIISVATPQLDAAAVELQTSRATTYYLVSGTSTEAIFASIETNGPTDDLGQKGSGLTSVDWEYKWTGVKSASGECAIRDLLVSADITIQLPQHRDEATLSPAILEKWKAYVEGVREHEETHVDIYLAGADDIVEAMNKIGVQASCDELETLIDEVWTSEQARITGLQHAFHNDEDARLIASRGPLEAQIDDKREALAAIQNRIAGYDEQITVLRNEIAVFDAEVANIDAQIRQINEQFPDELPTTIRDRLEQLIMQSNDLLVVYNARVADHNAAIFERNALSDQYDALLRETNDLVDQYNWTR